MSGAPAFPPVAPRSGFRAADAELRRRAIELADRVTAALGTAAPDLPDTPEQLGALLTGLAAEVTAALEQGPAAARSARLADLVCDLHETAGDLSAHAMTGRARRLAECERGLARLREITTTAGLIDGACDELVRCLGFRRAMLARVEDGMWRPWKANQQLLQEAWVPEWIEQSIALDELTLESQMLTERRPALVRDTNIPGIAQMVHAAGVRSYVAAPVMPGDQVVGFFHADNGVGGRLCEEVDRDLLWTFTEGFGHLYERTALLEQLQSRREQVRRALATVEEAMDHLTDSELELAIEAGEDIGSATPPPVVREGVSHRLQQLTPRELEVLELIVAGARNQEIADRLVITVGTVKSHVKNILAKLGVVNRSQAIAQYLGIADGR